MSGGTSDFHFDTFVISANSNAFMTKLICWDSLYSDATKLGTYYMCQWLH